MHRDLVEILRCPASGARLALDAFEHAGSEIEVGVLRGPAGDYPVVAGIPVMRGGDEDIVDLLRRGRVETATAAAVVRGVPLSRLDALLPLLAELRPTRSIGQRLAARRDRFLAQRARDALTASADDPDPLLRLTHVDNRRGNLEGYLYFKYRLGLPRHLVALGALAAADPGPKPIVEVGSGAGHATWQIARMFTPRRVIGIERELHLLWVARRHLATEAELVCGDALALPLADDTCSLGVAVDVLSFVDRKPTAVRELRRVVGDRGGLAITSVINATGHHEFAGMPLKAEDWRGLVAGLDHVALADTTILDSYLAGTAPPDTSDPYELLARSRTLTLLAGAPALARARRDFDGWPHAEGRLGLHPLLSQVASDGPDLVFARQAPSPGFDRDNPELDRYLPTEVRIPRSVLDDVRAGGHPRELETLLRSVAVLGHPDRWPADPWDAAR